jgi:hypothetical protein
VLSWSIATTIANVDDDEFAFAYAVIDKIGVTSRGKHAYVGNIRFSPETRVTAEQLASRTNLPHDGTGRTRIVLGDVLVNSIYVATRT